MSKQSEAEKKAFKEKIKSIGFSGTPDMKIPNSKR